MFEIFVQKGGKNTNNTKVDYTLVYECRISVH